MTGRLRSNFRSGNIAEDLGTLLLRGLAAVAEVPRQEDVGIDAVATLLRRDADGNFYAEDSFVVQFKSKSQKFVEYRDHELHWFLQQSQPMFIGHVCMQDASIALYPTIHGNQAAFSMHAKSVKLAIAPGDSLGAHAGIMGSNFPWRGDGHGSVTVWLEKPLLRWALKDITDLEWTASAYHSLKRFLGLVRREAGLLALGQCSDFRWETNDADSIRTLTGMMKGNSDQLQAVFDQCKSCLASLLLRAQVLQSDDLSLAVETLVQTIRGLGINTDPHDHLNLLMKMAELFRGHKNGPS